ncbi:MAG: ATP-binding cassette domain-containing protein [Myxococcales bacterium]|nr:ATP-binding cassette domain-containing protein [Myxococcales bacterium]
MTPHPVIQVRDLVKRYPTKTALDGVSFDVHAGEILGLLGPNGAGKSTSMKILTSYLSPSSGKVTVDGIDLDVDPVGVRALLGYLPESTPLYLDMVAYDYLMWIGEMRGFDRATCHRRIAEVASVVGIKEVIGMQIGQLSKGYKQRVGLAQALLHNPKILILDEPTSGLDPNQIVEIRNLIRDLGKSHTVILSSHNLAEVRQVCDRIVIIHRGKVVADGSVDELEGKVGASHKLVVGVAPAAGAPTSAVAALLAGLPRVKAAIFTHDVRAPVPHAVYDVEADADVRPELADAIGKAGHTIVELRRKSMDLEAIFQQLTHDV